MVHAFALLFVVSLFSLFGWLAGRVAARKGRPFWLYFAATLVVGPLALIGALLLARPRRERGGRVPGRL